MLLDDLDPFTGRAKSSFVVEPREEWSAMHTTGEGRP
jgi:hypothetical protein